jgi:hypothetical protein
MLDTVFAFMILAHAIAEVVETPASYSGHPRCIDKVVYRICDDRSGVDVVLSLHNFSPSNHCSTSVPVLL